MLNRHSKNQLPTRFSSSQITNIEKMPLKDALEKFITSRRISNASPRTIAYYRDRLRLLLNYAKDKGVDSAHEVDRDFVSTFFEWLEVNTKFTPGGRHTVYRSVKTFLGWIESAAGGEFASPMWGMPGPKLIIEPIKGISLLDAQKLIEICEGQYRLRDQAILMTLIDTGLRAQELLDLDIGDLDLMSGELVIRHGKGRKRRLAIIGMRCRKAIKRYLKSRDDTRHMIPLFTSSYGTRMTYAGLRQIIRRLSIKAAIKTPGLHDFRRLFAVTMHRNGIDDVTLARFMGHSSLEVLKRYLAEDGEDLQKAHRRGSPIDNSM